MNGDVGKIPSGVVFGPEHLPNTTAPTPSQRTTTIPHHQTDYSLVNGVGGSASVTEEVNTNVNSQLITSSTGDGGGVDSGPASTGPAPAPSTTPSLPMDQLKQMLSSQLDYYFSRENLANDAYLLSQMDNDQYVPIWTVANFNQVKKLTNDINLITEVLRESPNVQVDEEGQKVRPNHKRCIVILREIPDSTPLEQVKGLFSGKGCPKLISCEFAHNNSWYVTFENDEDAQKAYRFLREEVKEFQGKPIMARIKAKPINRPALAVGHNVSGVGNVMGPPGSMVPGNIKNGYRSMPGGGNAPGNQVYDGGQSQPPPYTPTPSQQRFLYPNGTTLPHSYPSQVQIYTFQGQPFYPPSMIAATPWGGPTAAAPTTYFDIGSVFSVNGLAPHQATFQKHQPHNPRFMPRNTRSVSMRSKRIGLEARTSLSDSGLGRTGGGGSWRKEPKQPPLAQQQHSQQQQQLVVTAQEEIEPVITSQVSSPTSEAVSTAQSSLQSKEQPRHRPPRRRKEDVATTGRVEGLLATPIPATTQFDLEATAFPPLPGAGEVSAATATSGSSDVEPPPPPPPPPQPYRSISPPTQTTSTWHSENRLSDVVKGTAKVKNGSPNSNNSNSGSLVSGGNSSNTCDNTATSNEQQPLPQRQVRHNNYTQIDKLQSNRNVVNVSDSVKTHSKTEDAVVVSSSSDKAPSAPPSATLIVEPTEPTSSSSSSTTQTTTATSPTHSTSSPPPPPPPSSSSSNQGDSVCVRLSYAQVAQHHKENKMSSTSTTTTTTNSTSSNSSTSSSGPVVVSANNSAPVVVTAQPESHEEVPPRRGPAPRQSVQPRHRQHITRHRSPPHHSK